MLRTAVAQTPHAAVQIREVVYSLVMQAAFYSVHWSDAMDYLQKRVTKWEYDRGGPEKGVYGYHLWSKMIFEVHRTTDKARLPSYRCLADSLACSKVRIAKESLAGWALLGTCEPTMECMHVGGAA